MDNECDNNTKLSVAKAMVKTSVIFCAICSLFTSTAGYALSEPQTIKTQISWRLVDDFEASMALQHWTNIDALNETNPFIANPQITEIRYEPDANNHYLLRKPAADGITGNRKALSSRALPIPINVGDTYTIYTRINVEYFPNNHSFGLSNILESDIPDQGYEAFEPMIRITNKSESDGLKNDGTLMVMIGDKAYSKINNPETGKAAEPLQTGIWYELWWVVNNAKRSEGGQRYNLYIRGGEFDVQTAVFNGADFRIQREEPLTRFIAITNTGPSDMPYGNGGVKYDDIYMAQGLNLSSPVKR